MEAKAETGRLYERVAGSIAREIASGRFAIGERLPAERALAQSFGVSRPTVREAIIALELDGLVEVRMGSGVYVVARMPQGGKAAATDIGPFELLEARRAIEGESCALAAARITDDELADLAALVTEMNVAGDADVAAAEDADRRFHLLIARATQNSAIVATVEMLWDARSRSPQYKLLSDKAHAAGVTPRIDEHTGVLNALRTRRPDVARAAMHDHLTRVLDSLLEATEVHELEQARARVAEQRKRYVKAA